MSQCCTSIKIAARAQSMVRVKGNLRKGAYELLHLEEKLYPLSREALIRHNDFHLLVCFELKLLVL